MLRSLIFRVFLAIALLSAPISSTWSIVVVDLETGEVAVVVATCLENVNLRRVIPAVVPGLGISAHQSIADPDGSQRQTVYELLQLGYIAPDIMAELNSGDPSAIVRQIGVVSMTGDAATFTGANCGLWAGGLTGQSGSLVYAIQGNVLAGGPVVTTAESALIAGNGSLAERLMTAMELSGAMGGDGRCSCSNADPDSCGTPPPNFTKSAHAFTMIVARPGDALGDCNHNSCARGELYCIINIIDNDWNDPDVIGVARQEFDTWKQNMVGRPDGYTSLAWLSENEVPAGTTAPIQLVLDLRDLDNNPLQSGGATITLAHDRWSAGGASLSAVHDHQDGTYTLDILASTSPGRDQLLIQIDDGGVGQTTVWPPLDLITTTPAPAPFAAPGSLAGLNLSIKQSSGFLFADGLTAWHLDSGPTGGRLIESTRPDSGSDFSFAVEINLNGAEHYKFNDFWVSADKLRLWLSGTTPQGGSLGIWFCKRSSSTEDFPIPLQLDELNSGLGDSDPWLNADETLMVFASKRGGGWDLWQSRRWQNAGRWLRPEKLVALDDGGNERSPMLSDNGFHLIFARTNSPAQINLARVQLDGRFSSSVPLTGSLAPLQTKLSPTSFDLVNEELWLNSVTPSGNIIVTAASNAGSLTASDSVISRTNGGRIDFQLDAGPARGGANYHLLISASGTSPPQRWNGAWVALVPDPWTWWSLNQSGNPAVQNFSGQLDANGVAAAILDAAPNTIATSLIGAEITLCFVTEQPGTAFVSDSVVVSVLN